MTHKYTLLIIISLSTLLGFYFISNQLTQDPTTPSIQVVSDTSTTITKNVLVLNFDPTIESRNNQKLSQVMAWSDPLSLQQQYVSEVKEISYNYVNYNIVETKNIDDYPLKLSGYHFTDEAYLSCMSTNTCNSELINYQQVIDDYDVCERVNSGEIDELWLWGGPWFGYAEAKMAGPNPFWTNSLPITTTSCNRHLNIMGFNYERSVVEMVHDLGHRTESVMRQVYRDYPATELSPYAQYIRDNQSSPELGNCGTIHIPVNGTFDYDYENSAPTNSFCGSWNDSYPTITHHSDDVNCSAWDCTEYGYLRYWFTHLPHSPGTTNGYANNWWTYVVDYENTTAQTQTLPLNFAISSGIDDYNTSCTTQSSGKEIYVGINNSCPSNPYVAQLVFQVDHIPTDSTLHNSYLSIVSDGPYANNLVTSITLSSNNITTSAITWAITEPWTIWERHQSPDLSGLLQELLDNPSWTNGPITLNINYISGDGHRRFMAYERSEHLAAPVLVINDPNWIQPPPVVKPGDLNLDGWINIFDYQKLITNFGNPYTIFDYQKIVSNFGK